MRLREKLKDHIVDKSKSKWNEKAINYDGEEIEIVPHSLEGEILLRTDVDERGRIKGWETISVEDMEAHLDRRDNPNNRPDETPTRGPHSGKPLRSLSSSEYDEQTRHKEWMDKWRQEGIDI